MFLPREELLRRLPAKLQGGAPGPRLYDCARRRAQPDAGGDVHLRDTLVQSDSGGVVAPTAWRPTMLPARIVYSIVSGP
jgi:hypothetical protein